MNDDRVDEDYDFTRLLVLELREFYEALREMQETIDKIKEKVCVDEK